MKDRLIHIEEGKWYRHGNHDFDQCCDCGLVHIVEYKFERGMLFERVWRDDKRTSVARKKIGVKVVKAK